jgi:hypothetical protein
MIGRSVAIGVSVMLVLMLATAAHAKKPNYKHRGLYLQLNGGFQAITRDGEVQAALSGKAGIDIVDHVALEVQFEGANDAERLVVTFQQRSKILTGRWQPFVVYGIGWATSSEAPDLGAVTAVALRFGGGLDYMITKNVSIGLDASFVVITNDLDDYGSFGIGVRYGW